MTQGALRAVVYPRLIWFGWLGLLLQLVGCTGRLSSTSNQVTAPTSTASGGRSRFLSRLEVGSSEALSDYNFVGRELHEWGPRLMQALDQALGPESLPRTVMIQLTLHPGREASIELSASPALPHELAQRLGQVFAQSRPPRTKLVDFSLRVIAKVGTGAPDGEQACLPKLWSPHEQRLARLRAASLGERVRLLQKWSQQEVMPVLSTVMRSAEPDFSGVRGIGELLASERALGPVNESLDKSPLYWRGLLEMSPGNPLLLSSRLFVYVARGELDLARLYLQPIYYFSKTDNLAHDFLEQLRDYLIVFYESLDARIRVGVELHDQARFDDAIALYDGILRDYPCSALAHYERWFAKNLREMRPNSMANQVALRRAEQVDDSLDEWEQTRTEVFRCNPMFEIDAVSRGEKRRQQMLRRLALRSLWKERGFEGADYLRYAEIALDLGEYGLAAHLYFLIGTGLAAKEYSDRKVLAHFLFSVEQLGVTELKELFKGDHVRDFADIAKLRDTRLRGDGKQAGRPGV